MNDDPIEDEYAYHITRQIVEYFRKLGFHVVPVPISRNRERRERYDWRYELRGLNKVFMLQFKRPNMRDKNISWELNQNQHDAIMNKRYIFYCLPKSKERGDMEVMLHRCLFKRASFDYMRILRPLMLRYCDGWGSFASKIIQCSYGIKLDTTKKKDAESYEKEKINFEKPVAVFGLSVKDKKMKVVANERILKFYKNMK